MGPKQPVSLGGIEVDAVLERDESYSASVPVYPVDKGFSVSDNMALDATELKMTLYVTATPVTWLESHGSGEFRIREVSEEIIEMYSERQPIEVITADKAYENMVISSLDFKRSTDIGYATEISVSLVQITVTSAETTEVPAEYLRAGKTQQQTGGGQSTNIGSMSQVIQEYSNWDYSGQDYSYQDDINSATNFVYDKFAEVISIGQGDKSKMLKAGEGIYNAAQKSAQKKVGGTGNVGWATLLD